MNIKDVVLEKADEEIEGEFDDSPIYFHPKEGLTEEQKTALKEETKDEFDAIVKEREEANIDEKIESLENQCKDGSEQSADTMFDIHAPTTKVKVQSIAGDMHQAYVSIDPKFSVSPRPEYAREGGQEVCDAQQDFLDAEMDKSNHTIDKVNRLVEQSAIKFGTGLKKKFHKIENRNRIRKETYQGTPTPMMDQQGNQVIENKGLEEFLLKYPDAIKDYPHYVKQLGEGKKITIDAQYTETVKNQPVDSFVKLKDFYCRLNTDGYDGLCNARMTAERIPFFWWELKAEEKKGYFFDIDKLKDDECEDGTTKEREGYREETYNIMLCVYQWYMKDGDEEPTKVLCWFEEDKWELIGVMLYPYDGVDCFYIPYHCKIEEAGFYQPGVAEDLTELNLIEDNLWNFGLEGMVLSNTFTPILKEGDNSIINQFLNKEFTHGVPLISKNPEQVFSLQSFMKPTSLNEVITSLHMIGRMEDDVSRVSSLKTGAENPVDPSAPATKTLALMKQSDKNIRDYIECMIPSYNLDAWMTLQMYAQIDREGGVAYKVNARKLTGQDPFSTITRAEMIARTNVQSRAMAFDFDKLAEKKQDLALLQVLLNEYMIAKRPESKHILYKTITKGWSPKWRNIVDAVIPSLEQLKSEEAALAAQGVATYLQGMLAESNATGVEPQINPDKLLEVVKQFASQVTIQPEKPKK